MNLGTMDSIFSTSSQGQEGQERSMSPSYWGLTEEDPYQVLKSLSKVMTIERRPRKRKEKPPWTGSVSQNDVFNPTLTSTNLMASEIKEVWKAKYGIPTEEPNAPRPVIPQGALTPAAARVLAKGTNRSGAKSRTSWSGEGLGVMAMLKDGEGSVSAPWKTLFNANPAVGGAKDAPHAVRENRVTGLYVKAGVKKSLRGKSSNGAAFTESNPLSTSAQNKKDAEAFPEGMQLQDQVNRLISEQKWQDLSIALCDLPTIRKFVCHQSAEDGILKILQLFNKACSALESTAKQNLDAGEVPPSAEYLERMRQHRRFILDHSTVLARRPQALLEKALFVSNTLPLVARNASEFVEGGDQMIRSMKERLKSICSTSTTNIRAAADLAVLKAQVREISLMGSMQNAFCPAAIAARYRLTVARIGKRIIQTRKTLLETGISVDEATLKEIILRDEGVYPSSFDESLAQQAIEEAKKALENLEKALDSAQAEKNQQKKQQMDAAANAKAEENELKAISESERSKDVAKSETSYRNIQVMRSSLCEEIWTRECLSRGNASLGGALCVDENRVFVSCDDTAIQVFDLDTLLFDFVKTYTLDGHAKTIICLATCDKNILFSGSLDGTIIVWNLEKMAQSQTLVGHASHVTCLAVADEPALSRNGVGKSLCSGSLDMTIKIWQGGFDEESLERVPSESSMDSHFSPVAHWVCLRTLIGHGCYVHSIVADGSTLYSAGEDGLIKIWSVDLKHSVGQLEGCQDSLYALCIDMQPTPSEMESKSRGSDGRKVLVSAGIELNMKGWDLDCQNIAQDGIGTAEDSVILDLSPMAEVEAVQNEVELLKKAVENAVTPEGRAILSENLVHMKEKAEHETRRSESFQFVKSLVCESGLLYSAGGEDVVRIWSLELGVCVGHIDEVGKGVYSLAASQDVLAVCCADKKLRIFGSADSQKRFEEQLESRETKFLNEGGELWALDLMTGSVRMFLPKVRISMMACGKNHGLLLDSHGYVWAWGEADKGQNGLGHQQASKTPKRIERLAGVQGEQAVESLRMKEIAAGDEHSLLLTHGGSVWVCGANMSGQLGMPETEESKTLFNEMQLVTQALDSMGSATAALHHDDDDHSQDRLKEKLKEVQAAWEMAHYVYIPTHSSVMKELRIIHLAAGKEHSVFVDDLGIAHTCGLAEHGQLGLSPSVFVERHDGVKVVRTPYVVNEPFKEPKSREATIKILNAACGDAHTVFLSEEGRAYSCGSNSHGQLGIGKKPDGLGGDEMFASIVSSLKEFALTQVAAGAQHSLFLTRSGEVYSCGNAEHGALGHGRMPKTSSLFVPRRIAGLTTPGSPVPLEVRHISASPYTSYFATTKGRSFYCGLKAPAPEAPTGNKSTRRRSVIAGEVAVLPVVDVPKRLEAPEHLGHVAIGPATNVGTLSLTQTDQEIIIVVDSVCVPFHPFYRIASTSGRNSPSEGNPHSMKGSPTLMPQALDDKPPRRASATSVASERRTSATSERDLQSPPRMVPFPGVAPTAGPS